MRLALKTISQNTAENFGDAHGIFLFVENTALSTVYTSPAQGGPLYMICPNLILSFEISAELHKAMMNHIYNEGLRSL